MSEADKAIHHYDLTDDLEPQGESPPDQHSIPGSIFVADTNPGCLSNETDAREQIGENVIDCAFRLERDVSIRPLGNGTEALLTPANDNGSGKTPGMLVYRHGISRSPQIDKGQIEK